MTNNLHEKIQSDIEKKVIVRNKKKKHNMKISGQEVKKLQRLIIENKNKNSIN